MYRGFHIIRVLKLVSAKSFSFTEIFLFAHSLCSFFFLSVVRPFFFLFSINSHGIFNMEDLKTSLCACVCVCVGLLVTHMAFIGKHISEFIEDFNLWAVTNKTVNLYYFSTDWDVLGVLLLEASFMFLLHFTGFRRLALRLSECTLKMEMKVHLFHFQFKFYVGNLDSQEIK